MYLPSDCEFLYQYVLRDQDGEVVWESILHRRQRNFDINQNYAEDESSLPHDPSSKRIEVPEETLDARESLLPPPVFECHDAVQREKRASMLACMKSQKVFSNVRMSVSGFYDCPDPSSDRRPVACARASNSEFVEGAEQPAAEHEEEHGPDETVFQDAEGEAPGPTREELLLEMEQMARERDQFERERRLVEQEVRRAVQLLREQGGCDSVQAHKSRASYCPEGGQIYDSLRVLQLAISTQLIDSETALVAARGPATGACGMSAAGFGAA